MAVIDRDHEWPELREQIRRVGVGGAVLVQVLNDAGETDDYLDLVAGAEELLGVVGWVDLLAADVGDRLDRLQGHPGRLVGVRHQAQAEADPAAWLRRADAGPGLPELARRGLVCDLMLRPAQLEGAAAVVARHPDLRFVLDHAGKPPVTSGWGSDDTRFWAAAVSRLARYDNVACKLSGLTTMADLPGWRVAGLEPYVAHLLHGFGPERLLFGSDWPVSRRAAEYPRTVGAVRRLIEGLSAGEQRSVLGGTAAEVYRLR